MPTQRLLGENEFVVHGHFEHAAFAGPQLPRADVLFEVPGTQNVIRQTDGAVTVASNRAVFDRNLHQCVLHVVNPSDELFVFPYRRL